MSTADVCSFREMESLLVDLAARIVPAIAEVERELPRDFPASVSDPIFEGLRVMVPRIAPAS